MNAIFLNLLTKLYEELDKVISFEQVLDEVRYEE